MVKRTKKIALALAALVALALGGGALAQAGSARTTNHKHATHHATKVKQSKARTAQAAPPDTDNVQSGDQSAPDIPGASEQSSESAGEATGSEVPNNDGPGGHADEPGNPAADHQFQGEE